MQQPSADISKSQNEHPLEEMLNLNRFVFCPGCLIGTVITSLADCLKQKGLTARDYAVVSGIGCTGRSSGCFKAPAFHTTHGRAIPFATGLKLAKPRLKVIVLSGDGDIAAIGGNHLIHAARRNIDISVVCVNNSVYGMTGGQVAPTTQLDDITATSPYGNIEPPFNLVDLSAASGATFVARWPGYDALRLRKSLLKALDRNGFSFIECIVPCFIQHGRRNRQQGALEMLEQLREIVCYQQGCQPHEAVLNPQGGRVVCGEFVEMECDGFVEKLQKLREHAQARDAETK